MSRDLVESNIVYELSRYVCKRLTRKAIARLQAISGEALSLGDGLINVWDEICVQVQSDESSGWESYDQTVRACLEADVDELPQHEGAAIWLQTPRGLDWEGDEGDMVDCCPVDHSEILDYLLSDYVYDAAARWSNSRITKYLER